jgi:hypothetical protein
MAPQKQIEANRLNAQKSTGPKTLEGREIVSRNATTHGLTATRAVVLPEEQEEFDRFAAALRYEWDPQFPLERFHLERMIHCAWRLKRVSHLETSLLLDLCQKEGGRDDPTTLGRAYIRGTVVFETLSRHERQIERSLREAQQELELRLYARTMDFNLFYVRNLKKFPAPGDQSRRRKASSTGGQKYEGPRE